MEKKSTKSGYRPSDSVKKRIAAWEGSAMTGAIDPLSGKWGKNRTFEEEASSFYHALPADIREQVISNPGLADNLFSYSYNVGAGRFKERVVPALRKYYAGRGSAEEIASSMWASGDKKLRGLRNRRAVERQGVVDSLAPSPIQPVFDVPTDNTFVFNPFPIHAESTTVAPIMVPDTYVEAHRLTPSEDRINRFQEAMEARRQYNNLMDAISIQNNPAPQYTPQNNPVNAPYVVASYDKGGYLRKSWNDLSMSEKAEMMKVAVRNGITNLQDIRDKYNEFAEGGDTNPYTIGATIDALYASNPREEFLGEPSHHYDFTQSDEWADAHGYYPDARGHRDDRVKKISHPSHPSRGIWNGDKFELTDFGMQNPNYTLFGLNDGGQDPQAILTYQGGIVLPEVTVTPNENYFYNPYDNIILHQKANGGKIHIKPSHRGRLTELKKRTGKSEAELYRTGSPATRKMITFARNARKWKHGLGGNLYPGGGFIGLMPAMPGIAIDSNAAENIATTASKKVMNYIKGAHDTGSYFSYDPSMEAYTGPAQDTYLLPRKLQEKEFLRRGYIKGKDKDYGLVKRAVGDRDLPVYQRNPDAITRNNLTVIGNIHGWDPWYGSADTALEHPGSYPTAVYTDAEGNFFQKGWDLNDYGGKTGSTIGFLSDIVDRIGSPTVVTTGYQPVSNPQDKNFIQAITPMMAKKGLVPTEINGKTEWVLPEVTITGKKKKALGGNLFDGTSQDSQKMQIGLNVQGWPDYTTEQIVAYGEENERRRKALEDAYLNFVTESNDATAVASGRPQNQHLEERGIKGAKAHAAWEKEHPVATQWGNVLGAVPFAVAAYPLAATAGSGAAALGDAAATTSVGQGITNFLAPIATTSYAGATAPQWFDLGLTSGFGAHGIQTAVDEKGISPMTALEVAPLGRGIKVIPQIEKRAAETAMRTTPLANPLPEMENELVAMWKGQDGGKTRIAHILDYVLTGAKTGPKGYYNSLAGYVPMDNSRFITNSSLKQRWHDFNNPQGVSYAYSGFVNDLGRVPAMTERSDIIDAFLYGKDIDPSFGLTKIAKGKEFGHHTEYVNKNYSDKANNINVYEVNTPYAVNAEEVVPSNTWNGNTKGLFYNGKGENLNVAGHRFTTGVLQDGTPVRMEQDIWKFQPDEYYAKWLENNRKVQELPKWKRKLLYYGLKEVDRIGTPVITRTQWHK